MKKRIKRAALAVLLIVTVIWVIRGNTALQRTDYTVSSGTLPEAFHGFRIAQVSDLHNASFGENNQHLLEMLREAKPDLIAITGDMIDSRHTDVETALTFAEQAVKIAPCYFVTGNHELRMAQERAQLEQGLEELGVTVLRGGVTLTRDGQEVTLLGVDDVSAITTEKEEFPQAMDQLLSPLDTDGYSILLFHRPICFPAYEEYGIELVLTGHNHGGQFRLPFLGGVFCSGEFFHPYDAGIFWENDTAMIVSRGLGNSLIPFRINNNPEVVIITLASEKGATP